MESGEGRENQKQRCRCHDDGHEKPLHIAMFPSFAFGHITPFIHLSNTLSSSHGIKISFLSTPTIIQRIKPSLVSPETQAIPLAFPQLPGLEPGAESTSDVPPSSSGLLNLALDRMQPQIKALLSDLRPNFIFFDFAQHWIPDISSELGIKSVFFSVFSAIADSYITPPSRITSSSNGSGSGSGSPPADFNEMKRPPRSYPRPGLELKTFEARNLMYVFKSFDVGELAVFDRKNKGMQSCDAIVYKSCLEMEAPYIDYLKTQYGGIPILLAGLTLPSPNPPPPPQHQQHVNDDYSLAWLNQFPAKSVIFCSFGSETFLDPDQIHELVLGLELTGSPFLLVLNSSSSDNDDDVVESLLPRGFTNARGMVRTGWVPQREILMHDSVGCYVNHCGFSSVMEALLGDCQLVLVPFKGDQFLNAKLLSSDLGVGVEVKRRDEDGWFGKDDIAEAVRAVMMVSVDNKETTSLIRVNHRKWRDFLMRREVEDRYVAGLVEELKALAYYAAD